MPFRTLFTLILCNVIWSAHPLMGKYLMLGFTPAQGAWLRYTSGFVSYALAVTLLRRFGSAHRLPEMFRGEPFLWPCKRQEFLLIFALGFSAFCASPLLQMIGLSSSRATDNAMIVAMEPLFTVFLAWVVLHERPSRLHLVSFAVALAGFAMLTGLRPGNLGEGLDPHFVGNFLMLLSLLGEALYSALGRKLLVQHSPTAVFGSAIAIGAVCLTGANLAFGSMPDLAQFLHMPWQSALSLLWLGPFGTALSYLYWMSTLKKAPVASIALTLFVQPILGPLWGAVFLNERLSLTQGLGSVLILVAVFGQTWFELRRHRGR